MNTVLVGAQWGDEGKGKVIDFLTEEADVYQLPSRNYHGHVESSCGNAES